VAVLAIDKMGPRPYHFRSGPTTRSQEAKKVKLKPSLKLQSVFLSYIIFCNLQLLRTDRQTDRQTVNSIHDTAGELNLF